MTGTERQIVALEAEWRAAYDAAAAAGWPENLTQAEESAWDRYGDMCDDIGQCQQPGCRVIVPDYAYCSGHRPA